MKRNDGGGLVLTAGERAVLAKILLAEAINNAQIVEWEDVPELAEPEFDELETLIDIHGRNFTAAADEIAHHYGIDIGALLSEVRG